MQAPLQAGLEPCARRPVCRELLLELWATFIASNATPLPASIASANMLSASATPARCGPPWPPRASLLTNVSVHRVSGVAPREKSNPHKTTYRDHHGKEECLHTPKNEMNPSPRAARQQNFQIYRAPSVKSEPTLGPLSNETCQTAARQTRPPARGAPTDPA